MSGEQNDKLSASQIFYIVIYPILYPVVLLGLAGDWTWAEGWLWAGLIMLTLYAICLYLYFKDIELLKERFQSSGSKNQESWDKGLLRCLVTLMLLWMVLIPLDARRFGWSPVFIPQIKIFGGFLYVMGLVLISEVFRENTFLSPYVRLQSERKQKVITTGLYGVVRHPMYAGLILWLFGSPLFLGSIVGIALAGVITILLGIRSIGEERMLTEELEGYATYRHKVRYRLLPYVW